jgi:hypothetical protein
MKLLYFTTEDLNSGLFQSQVFGLLKAVRESQKNIYITILVINQPWKVKSHINILELLKKENIEVIYIPLLPPMRWLTYNFFISNIYLIYLTTISYLFVNFKKYDFIHCRHYLTSLVLIKLRYNNFLFDVRSLHVFEYIQAKKIKINSITYNYWLNLEKLIIQKAAAVSVVSKTMIPYFESIHKRKYNFCPIIADFNVINYCLTSRLLIRNQLKWNDKRIYVYSGSFGLYGINKEYLAKMLKFIIKYDNNSRFLFLVSNHKNEVEHFISVNNFDPKIFHIKNTSYSDMYRYLSAADIGIHSLPNQIDGFSRLGTKIIEYWASGLPVIINNNIGEAARICIEHNFGKVINFNLNQSDFDLIITELNKLNRNKIYNDSEKLFSSYCIAQKYITIYTNCLESK